MQNKLKIVSILKKHTQYILLAFLLSLIPLQTLTSIKYKSASVEEGVHLAAGAYYLRTGDFNAFLGYPFIIRMWFAAPLWISGIKLPDHNLSAFDVYPFEYASSFLYESNNADTILFQARFMVVVLSLLLGIYLFYFAKDLFGLKCAFISLFFYVFSPNILAHSRLVTPDLPLTAFLFIALFYFRKAVINGSKKYWLFAALFTFLTINTKHTGLLIFIVFIIWNIILFVKKDKYANQSWKVLLFVLLFSLFTINLEYGFKGSFITLKQYNNLLNSNEPESSLFKKNSKIPVLSSFPIPLPVTYLRGIDLSILHDAHHPNWYYGKLYINGKQWWHYYLSVIALKTPLPTLLLIVLAFLLAPKFLTKHPESTEPLLFILLPCIVFLIFYSFICRSQLGLRLILSAFPFLFLFMSVFVKNLLDKDIKYQVFIGVCFCWLIVSSIRIYPHYLSYFNCLIGHPSHGIKYFADSNIDWGQDLKGLKKYMEQKGIDKINLVYYGPYGLKETEYYGVKIADPILEPDKPWAISRTWLYYANIPPIKDVVPFAFDKTDPDDMIGYSIGIYYTK